tara:strand:- start:219 stop:1691 length:1473 start_codon:yes stop_codon:yes gene_type:complete
MDTRIVNVMEMVRRNKIDNIYIIWHREEYRKTIEQLLEGTSAKVTYIGPEPNGKDPNFAQWLQTNDYRPIPNWKQGDKESTTNFTSFHNREIRNGEIACAIGHLRAWKQAKEDGAQCPLFLEQDAEPKEGKNFADIEEEVNNYLNAMQNLDWDVFYLGTCGNIITEETPFPWLKRLLFTYCTQSYIVTPSGIDELLNYDFDTNLCPVDEYIPAFYSKDGAKIHPYLQHLKGKLKAYQIESVTQSNAIVKYNLMDGGGIPDGVSDTEDSPIYKPPSTHSYPELIVIDDFIKDENLLKDISNDDRFWEYGYRWWNGWWNNKGTDLRHKLIEYIYRYNCPFPIHKEEGGEGHGQGFEHWIGIQTPETTGTHRESLGQYWALNPHQDKDEDYWENHPQGKNKGDHMDSIKTPKLGTVFYVEAPERGGNLKIWDEGDFHKITEDTPFQLIKPKRNRLIIFNAGNVHAVEPVIKGIRKAVAINIWDPKPTTKMEEE